MAESTADKTHDPTPHRRQQARRDGHVARSHDVSAAVLLIGGAGAVYFLGRPVVEFLGSLMTRQLGGEPWLAADLPFALRTWNAILSSLAWVLLPVLGVIMLCGAAGNVLQVGLLFLPAKVVPDFSRIDPAQGFRRLFSQSSLSRLGFGILKLVAVGAVGWYSLASEGDRILNCGHMPLPDLADLMVRVVFGAAFKVGLALAAVAALDYALERWRYERDLRMTVGEIREEQRHLHGDAQIISRRRTLVQRAHKRDGPAKVGKA